MDRAYLFPGQGSQEPGMGKDLYQSYPQAREVMDQAEEIVPGLLPALFSGDKEVLAQTEIAQPAILTVSAALWQLLAPDLNSGFLLGHSLGEYSALYAGGVFEFTQVLSLVQERARLMMAAAREIPGGMMAVLGLPFDQVDQLIKAWGLEKAVFAANHNSPQQTVVSGTEEGLKVFSEYAANQEIKVVKLAVSGPFHSPFMSEAAWKFKDFLGQLEFRDPEFPVLSATTGSVLTSGEEIRAALINQFTHPVLWVESVNYLQVNRVKEVVEIGPGRVLTGLVRRIAPDLRRINIQTAADVLAFKEN